MAGKHWTLDDIPWDRFDPDKVDPEILKVAKAASMVEYNGGDYATYLCNVFADDPAFQAAAKAWAAEEVQHGLALGIHTKIVTQFVGKGMQWGVLSNIEAVLDQTSLTLAPKAARYGLIVVNQD